MDAYLDGQARDENPIWEIVVDGRALIYGTDLREEAYRTVKATWPKSLAMLEFARLGVECSVDVGLISAMAINDGDGLEIRYFMNFDAKDDSDFVARVQRLIESGAPIRRQDLQPDAEWVLPDIRDQYFRISTR